MNHFDSTLLLFLNRFACKSSVFDHLMCYLADAELLKGGVFFAFLWAAWSVPSSEQRRRRATIVATLAGCAASLFVARATASALPFRMRPINDAELGMTHPLGLPPRHMIDWSSFPSDHAALFFGLVTGVFLLSRTMGVISFLYVVAVVVLPRLYLGIHWPSDIFAGAVPGIFLVWLMNRKPVREPLASPLLGWCEMHPWSFYFCFYLVSYQFVVLFTEVRDLGHLVSRFLGHHH